MVVDRSTIQRINPVRVCYIENDIQPVKCSLDFVLSDPSSESISDLKSVMHNFLRVHQVMS